MTEKGNVSPKSQTNKSEIRVTDSYYYGEASSLAFRQELNRPMNEDHIRGLCSDSAELRGSGKMVIGS